MADIDSATTGGEDTSVKVYSSTQVNTANPVPLNTESIKTAAQSGISNIGSTFSNIVGQVQEGIGALANKFQSLVNLGNITQAFKALTSIVTIPGSPPYPNVLHNYASYNYIFTLSVLDNFRLAFPDESYRLGDIGPVILKSGSGDPNNRIMTSNGKFDFFIEDLRMQGIIGFDAQTSNTNSINLSFKVIEPYSMGLFFESIQTAAMQAGHENYLIAPYLLKIEFKGHLNPAQQGIPADALSIENTTKYVPIKITEMDMTVTGRGAEYNISAVVWNEQGYSNIYSELKTEVSINGGTVHEMLQTGKESLQAVLNRRLQEAAKKQERDPDQILITFPGDLATSKESKESDEEFDAAATVNPQVSTSASASIEQKLGVSLKENGNQTLVQDELGMNPIGRASMGFNEFRKGDTPFSKDNFVYDSETHTYTRGNISIDVNKGNMRFAQGGNIVDVINQVILMSDYGRQALKSGQVSETGKFPWWRIETQFYNIPSTKNFAITGTPARMIVYRVVPYGVDISTVMPPNTPNPNVEAAKMQAIKEYNYIYTSKNLDILKFDINFKAGFFQALNADVGKNTMGKDLMSETGSSAADENADIGTPATGGSTPLPGDATVVRQATNIKTSLTNQGGGSVATPEVIAAKQTHEMVVNGVDMIGLDLTILGDPYYIGDSGLGNYTAKSTQYENMNSDHSIDYQSGEVHIIVNFRTPIDVDVAKGAYTFGPTVMVNQFSGLYRVMRVESLFNRGRFTQNISLIRLPGQTGKPIDSLVSAVKTGAAAVKNVFSVSSETVTSAEYEPFDYDGEKNSEIDP